MEDHFASPFSTGSSAVQSTAAESEESVGDTRPTAVCDLDRAAREVSAVFTDRVAGIVAGVCVVALPEGAPASAVLEPVVRTAQDRGAAVIRLVCDPTRPRRALRGLVEASMGLAEGNGQRLTLPPLVAAATVEGERYGSTTDPSHPGWRQAVFNLNEGVRALVGAASQARPLLIAVEAAAHIDPDFDAVLAHLAQWVLSERGFGAPVRVALLVVEPAATRHRATSEWARHAGVHRVEVVGLGRQALLDSLASNDAFEPLLELSGGVPARAEALLRLLPELLESHRQLHRPPHGDTARFARLLALAELPLSLGELCRALDLDDFSGRRIAGGLRQGGWIESGSGGRLSVPLTEARALLEGADVTEIQALHSRLAELFADRWSFDGEAAGLQAATTHWIAAGELSRAVRFGLRAAEQLRARLALHRERALCAQLRGVAVGVDKLRVLSRLAEVSVALGRNSEAVEALRQAEALFHHAENAGGVEPRWAFSLGRLYLACGSLDDAIRLLAIAASPQDGCSSESTDAADLQAVYAALAQAHSEAGHLPQALAACEKAGHSAEARMVEGAVRFRLGELDATRAAWEQAASLAPDLVTRSRALHNLGLVALREGRYAEAVRALQQSLGACEQAGEFYGAAQCHFNLGVAYEHMERFALAERSEGYAADIFWRLGNRHMHAWTLATLGDLALQLGDYRKAGRLLRRAVAEAEAVGSEYKAAQARLKLAQVAVARGRFGAAASELERATDFLRAYGQHEALAWAAVVAAELAVAQGDVASVEKADESLDGLDIRPNHESRAQMLLSLARAALLSGRCQEASRFAGESLERFTQLASRRGQLEALSLLLRELPQPIELADGTTAASLWECAATLAHELLHEVPEAYRASFARLPAVAGWEERSTDQDSHSQAAAGRAVNEAPVDLPPEQSEVLGPVHPSLPGVLGSNPAMVHVGQWVERVSQSDAVVLIVGESGTGKELVAEAIHQQSARAGGPFVRVNVAALPDSLIESELFGHERGAFTGAVARHRGKFELAHRGTLFLDEIGDISARTQVRLLRVLQSQRFERVGGVESVQVDVRVVCATNRPLEAMVQSGEFRLDLYHRIRGVTLRLPALRERGHDAVLLARHFLRETGLKQGRVAQFTQRAELAIRQHGWPGNVRELENVVRTAFVLSEGGWIDEDALQLGRSRGIAAAQCGSQESWTGALPNLDDARRDLELRLIGEALERTDGNITRAAELLGMKRPRLSQKVKEYGLSVPGRDVE